MSDNFAKICWTSGRTIHLEKTYFDTTRIMDGTTGEISFAGAILDGKFKLEKLLRHDGHADVYSVRAIPPQTTSLEARAYSLEALPQKLRQYRLRNIKRLSSRTVLETRWQGMTVIIYKAGGCGGIEGSGNNVLVESLPLDRKSTPVVVNKKLQQKSGRQREKARVRQLERRKSSRQKERHSKAVESPAGTSINDVKVTMKEAEQDEPTHLLLHHTQSDQPPSRRQLAARCRTALENIFKQDLKFENDDEREDLLEIMYHEVVRLRYKQKKLPGVLERRDFSATRKIPEKGYRDLIRPDPSQARNEMLAGICGGVVYVDVAYRNLPVGLSLASQKKEDMERQKRGLKKLRALGIEKERR